MSAVEMRIVLVDYGRRLVLASYRGAGRLAEVEGSPRRAIARPVGIEADPEPPAA